MKRDITSKEFVLCFYDDCERGAYHEETMRTDERLLERYDRENNTDTEGIVPVCDWHYLIENIDIGWRVESDTTQQSGNVIKVITNKWNIPVCVEVVENPKCECFNKEEFKDLQEYISGCYHDFISIDRISRFDDLPDGYYVENGMRCVDIDYLDDVFREE